MELSEIQPLLDRREFYYRVGRPNLRWTGQRLFCWLDGEERWLTRAINQYPPTGTVLAVTAQGKLGRLPWEVLHDGQQFLVERTGGPVTPVRCVKQGSAKDPPAASSPLQVVFMAASPEDVKPVLDFEAEEARILRITEELPLKLRVEESGCVKQLSDMWRRFRENTYQVFHLSAQISTKKNEGSHPYFITESPTGERCDVSGRELMQSFGNRFPRLVVLSGWHTGQGADSGAVSSIAETLVKEGVQAVVCLGSKSLDSTGSLEAGDRLTETGSSEEATTHFYKRLAEGFPIAEAVRSTYRELLERQSPNWCLMRLYACSGGWGQLAQEPEDDFSDTEPVQTLFLDSKNKVRVASAADFVGRRRLLQGCLHELRSKSLFRDRTPRTRGCREEYCSGAVSRATK